MTSGVQYQVVPLVNREQSNKATSTLEKKYQTATNKRVTLNERFGVLEKGYILQAGEPEDVKKESNVFFVVHDRNLISKKEFVENYLRKNPFAESPKEVVEEDKENAPSKKDVQKMSINEKKPYTTDDYVRDITESILKSV